MKIFIPKPDWQLPTMCASCGSVLSGQFIEKYLPVESINTNHKVKAKLPYLRCAECNTFLSEVRRFYRPEIRKGFWVGFLVGVFFTILIMASILVWLPDRQEMLATMPKTVYSVLILAALMLGVGSGWVGIKITDYRLFWGKKLPDNLRERIQRVLKPIKVKKFMAFDENQGFTTIKDQKYYGFILLELVNDHFAKTLVETNRGEVLTLYCSKCGKEIEEEKEILSPISWSASVCPDCRKVYCPECLDYQPPVPCPDCKKLLFQAGRKEILSANLFSDYATFAFLGETKN
jgi:hypothetical protein